MYQRVAQNRAKEKELRKRTKILFSLILLAWWVGLEVPRTGAPSVVSNTSRTFFSSQTSLFGWEGESDLKLGIVEVDSGGS